MHYGGGAVLVVVVGSNGRSTEINTDCQECFFTHKRVRFECDQCDIIESWVRKLEVSQKCNSRLHSGGGYWARQVLGRNGRLAEIDTRTLLSGCCADTSLLQFGLPADTSLLQIP